VADSEQPFCVYPAVGDDAEQSRHEEGGYAHGGEYFSYLTAFEVQAGSHIAS